MDDPQAFIERMAQRGAQGGSCPFIGGRNYSYSVKLRFRIFRSVKLKNEKRMEFTIQIEVVFPTRS